MQLTTDALLDAMDDLNGVLSRNRRNFRHPSSSPATIASRSIILALLWKSLGEFSASAGGCLPGRQPSLRTLDETASSVQ